MHDLRAHLLKRFEYYVAAMAVTFVAVSVGLVQIGASTSVTILAAIQWADRERQRRLRSQAIAEIREMLTDQVINQLAAVRMWMMETPDPEMLALILTETDATIERVADLINDLSEEQLDTWRLTYANVADHIAYSSIPDYAPA